MAEDLKAQKLLLELADRFERGEMIGGTAYAGICAMALREVVRRAEGIAAPAPAPVKADTAAGVTTGDIAWLLGAKDVGRCGEGFLESKVRRDHNERIDRLLAAISHPAAPPPTEGGEQNSSSRSQPCADAGPCPRSSFDIQGDLNLLGGLVLHLEDGRPLTIGDPLSLAGALRRVLSEAYPNRSNAVVEIRNQLYALCEDMGEEAFANLGRVDLVDHQAGYYRGMKYAAKATARAMGEVFRDMLRDGGEAVHTGQLREEPKDRLQAIAASGEEKT